MRPSRGGHTARIVELFEQRRAEVSLRWERRLREEDNPLVRDRETRRECLECADEILDVWRSTLLGGQPAAPVLARRMGAGSAGRGLHKGELIRAASALFDVVAEQLRADVPRESAGALVDALLSLHRDVSGWIEVVTDAHDAYVLEQVHGGLAAYRKQLARDIHDQLGNGLSVAMRQLELYQLCVERDRAELADRMDAVNRSFAQLFGMIRSIITDLRACVSGAPLEKSLWEFVHLVEPARTDVSITVTGDSAWLPDFQRCQLETIVREAMRNAFQHASAPTVAVRVHIAPHGVRATVSDSGRGFDLAEDGHGLASMRERVELGGGTLRIATAAGNGTRVDLWLPLATVPHLASVPQRAVAAGGGRDDPEPR